ncbi:MAG: hypothetical protein ACLR7U_01395 [Ruthenibacterium lactatiformans]
MLAKLIKHEFKATARFSAHTGHGSGADGAAALTVKLGGILVLPGGTGWGGRCSARFRAAVPAHLYCNDGHDDGRGGRHHPAVLQKPAGGRGYLMFTRQSHPRSTSRPSWPWAQCGRSFHWRWRCWLPLH